MGKRKITRDDVEFLLALKDTLIQHCNDIKGNDCSVCRWDGCGCCPVGVYGNYLHLTDASIKMLEGVEIRYENESN